MLAVLDVGHEGHIARFERVIKSSAENVWLFLSENDRISKWFPELKIQELRIGGVILFDLQGGSFDELKILDLKTNNVLEFTWWEDRVRFELYPVHDACRLILIEQITQITKQTSKDLAGWHVCLEAIKALAENSDFEVEEVRWEILTEQYGELLNRMK